MPPPPPPLHLTRPGIHRHLPLDYLIQRYSQLQISESLFSCSYAGDMFSSQQVLPREHAGVVRDHVTRTTPLFLPNWMQMELEDQVQISGSFEDLCDQNVMIYLLRVKAKEYMPGVRRPSPSAVHHHRSLQLQFGFFKALYGDPAFKLAHGHGT